MKHVVVVLCLLVLSVVAAFAAVDFDKILSFEVSHEKG